MALVSAVAALMLPVAPLVLAFGFAAILGAGAGLSSIVRGAVPVALFGVQGLGARLGRLAAIRNLLGAAAPFLFAVMVARASMSLALIAMLGLAAAGLIALHRMLRRVDAVRPLRARPARPAARG